MNTLTVQNVVKRYASHTALDDVSLSIPKNSIFGLLGPNGAGKTSLIRIINQITGPDSGTLFFENEPLTQKHIQQIGYLPEERGLYKKMEVGEQALYLAQLKGMKKAEAKKKLKYWFEKFEIDAWWNKKIEELSKGMQQKVQFIVTVLHEPKLLILDEPFSGFDPINANIIKNEILNLKAQGSTILFSTHNMGSVEELCDNIALINKSKKILDGPVKEIKKQHKTNVYEIEFTGNMMGFSNSLWTYGKLGKHTNDGEIYKAQIMLTAGSTANQLLESILPVAQIHSFKEIVPNMNDIFISMVNQGNEMQAAENMTE
ncbi:MAG: ATP-binding cassette domain-containing protein [Bacteroidia bacterium]|nr:ATP-binding cassette domain-containing protein [Bacteroidia bacterium]